MMSEALPNSTALASPIGPTGLTSPTGAPAAVPQSPWRLFWVRLWRHKTAMVGAGVLIFLYFCALLAGFLAPYSYERQDRERFFHPPTALGIHGLKLAVYRYEAEVGKQSSYLKKPNDWKPVRFWVRGDAYNLLGCVRTRIHCFGTGDKDYPVYLLGTDQFGRDILSRILYGSQISLSIGLMGIVITFSLGMLIGAAAGYFGGWSDTITMRFCEIVMSIPGLYLIMALRATFPPKLSSTAVYFLIVVIMSFVRWAGTARVIRGMALSLRERPFILAAKALGQTDAQIIVRHLLPATFSYLIVAATLSVPYYILGEVVLSFLGVGIQEPDASWGIMLSAAQNTEYLRSYPWLLAPGGAIFVTVLAFNFLGDGLRDAADTRTS